MHCHDDLGLAVANSLAAVQTGARQMECTINGIGERAGNAALEEVVMAMNTRRDRLPFETRIVTEQLFPASQMLTSIITFGPQPNKAIVGENAFAHEAGIHQDGYLKERTTYEIMEPQVRGRAGNEAGAGQAQRPPRAGQALRRSGLSADAGAAGRDVPPLHRAGGPQERPAQRRDRGAGAGGGGGDKASSVT